jgi:2-keto-4-pentenoate hydratase/2-oxohepta-3-ene-1,7-dioic acid hydratase in catechol pathway
MKLASFKIGNSNTWGVIEDEEAIDVGSVLKDRHPDLKSAIAADALPVARDATREAKRCLTADITWLPVIPNPGKILCLNYETHRKETGRSEVENPTVFGRFSNSQTGHLANIIRPKVSHDLGHQP